MALTKSPEFWDHVEEVRRNPTAAASLARRYVRRDQGRRRELIEALLCQAAEAENHNAAKIQLWNAGINAHFVGGIVKSPMPQRALRKDAADTLTRAAIRVARRGGRQMHLRRLPRV